MQISIVKKLVETRLLTITPTISIAFEGVKFTPVDNQPYLKTQFYIDNPTDNTLGCNYYRENITFQVFVAYPENKGTGDALNIAESIRALFPKGLSLQDSNVSVRIIKTPHIGSSIPAQGRIVIPVMIELFVEIG